VQDVVIIPQVASLSRKCPECAFVLELTESCWKCGTKVEQDVDTAPHKEKQSFKPYLDKNIEVGKEIYERLIQAFSEMDSSERPWCGIGVKVDLLAVSPRGVTVAVIKELRGIDKGLVYVSQNWREPWRVETIDGEQHQIQSNPCEQADRAISAIKNSLRSFRKSNDHPALPCIKCLIIFPDGYEFEGPKDFSILDPDDVVTLKLRQFRDLSEAILQPTQQERLDSRKYRKWIESDVLRSNDESILGTWLDPAFDTPEPELPKGRFWRLRHARQRGVPAEEKELASSDSSRMRPLPKKFKELQLKLTATVITGMVIGMVGWRLYDVTRPINSLAHSRRFVSPPRLEQPTNANPVIQRESVPVTGNHKAREVREAESTREKQRSESAKSPRAQTQASEDSELKRKKIELQIHGAILLRAITGVTVSFVGETAYLEGQLATENQKSAAEKAARSIPGVEEVRNSIEVNRFSPADG